MCSALEKLVGDKYFVIKDIDTLNKIYDLFQNNKLFDPETTEDAIYLGIYHFKKRNYDLMKECYQLAIDASNKNNDITNNIRSLIYMADYYICINDSNQAEKYYLAAVDLESKYLANLEDIDLESRYNLCDNQSINTYKLGHGAYKLGMHYIERVQKKGEKDKEQLAIKYLDLAATRGNVDAMHMLGKHYYNKEYYVSMLKYWIMAAEKEYALSMLYLAMYYRFDKQNYFLAETYYLKAIKQDDECSIYAMEYLADYYFEQSRIDEAIDLHTRAIKKGHVDSMVKLNNMCVKHNMHVEQIELHMMCIESSIFDHLTNRDILIRMINKYAAQVMIKTDKWSKFINLLSKFDFKDTDELSMSVRSLIEHISHNTITDNMAKL